VAALPNKMKPLPFYQNCGLPCDVHFNNLPSIPELTFHSFFSGQEFFKEYTVINKSDHHLDQLLHKQKHLGLSDASVLHSMCGHFVL
jgi:hypothetical protein